MKPVVIGTLCERSLKFNLMALGSEWTGIVVQFALSYFSSIETEIMGMNSTQAGNYRRPARTHEIKSIIEI